MHATVVRPERAARCATRVLQDGVGTADGRDADHDDDVAVRVVVERVDRRTDAGPAAASSASSCHVPADHEPGRRDRLGDERRHRRGAGQDRGATPGGQRLVREDLRDVEQLVRVLDAHDPGLAQHLRERARRGVRRPDGVPRRHDLAGPPGRHDDHGLDQRQPPGHPGELARVAERLEVQADDVRAVVVGPELHEVVAGHVGAVPGGDELRDADAPPPDRREQRDGQRRRLAEQPDPPAAAGDLAPATR